MLETTIKVWQCNLDLIKPFNQNLFKGDYINTVLLTNTRTEVSITVPGCSWLPYLAHIPM